MAGTKALNVRMNFQVDTTQARQQIQQLGTQLNSITKASNFGSTTSGITSQILEATKAAAQLKTAISEAVNPLTGNLNLTAFNDQLRISGTSLTQYRDQLASLGTVGNQTFNSLARSIALAETPLLGTSKVAQTLWTTMGNTIRWQATSSLMHGIMNTASQAMSYVQNLDNSLNSIRIVTGQNQAQMEKFARTANIAAKELNTTTNAYAQASLIYYQQGLSNKEVEARTATTIKLANVAGESASKVSNQLTSIWNNFYDGSKSLEYYADVMTALGASTASSTDEIAKGLEKFSSIAKTTGLSYEYATSALSTVVAATRQSADSVGTSFKTLFSRLQGLNLGETLEDGTTLNKYSQALNTIGVNIKNANGTLKDMDTILDEIGDKWETLSKSEQVALAQTVGGARNYTSLVSLMDNWSDFQVNLKTAQQAQGTLQNQADIYAESWEAASKHVRTASETIYKNLLDDKFFKGLTNGFGSVLDIIGSITNGLGGFGGTMTALVAMGSKIWAPQLTQSFNTLGMNLRGRNEAIKMQEDAIAALKEPTYVSQYSSVNNLQNQINKDLHDNIILQRQAVETGKLPTYLQPAYNTMMNIVDSSGQQALQATSQLAENNRIRYLDTLQAQARLNVAGKNKSTYYNQQYKDIQNQIQNIRAAGGTPSQDLLRQERYWGQMSGNISFAVNPGGQSVKGAMPIIRTQEEQAVRTTIQQYGKAAIQDSFRYTNDDGNYSAKRIASAIGTARTIYSGANGDFKEMTRLFGTATAKDIMSFYNATKNISDVSKMSATDLQELGDALMKHHDIASNLDRRLVIGADSLESLMSDMETRIRDHFGEIQGKDEKTQAYMSDLRSRIQNVGFDNFQKMFTEGRYKELAQILGEDFKGLINTRDKRISGAETATKMTQTFASVGTAVLSGVNAIKTLGDESATAGQKASALVTAMGTMPMAISSASKFIGDWNSKIGDSNVTMRGATLATLGLTAAIAGTVFAVKQVQLSSNTSAIKALGDQAAVATQAVSDAQAKYDNLLSGRESQNNLLNKLYSLEKGTENFSLALVNANEAARNLIDQYDLIYGEDYNYGQNGEIILNQASLNQKEEEAIESLESISRGKALNTYAETLLSLKEEAENSYKLGTEAEEFLSQNIDTNYINDTWSLFNNTKGQTIESQASLRKILNDYASWYFHETLGAGGSFKQFLATAVPEAKGRIFGSNDIRYNYANMTKEAQQAFIASMTSLFGNLDNIEEMMGSISEYEEGDWESLSGENITQLVAQYTNHPDLAENSEIQQRRRAAALGMIETAGQGAKIQDDLTKFAIKYMESDPNAIAYQEAIAKAMYNAETITFVEKLGSFFGFGNGKAADLELLYKTLFETQIVPEDLKKDEEQLKLAVATKFGEYLNLNGLSEDIIEWIGKDALVKLNDFQGLNEIRKQLEQDSNLKNLINYSSSNIADIYTQVEGLQEHFKDKVGGAFYQNIALTLTNEISRTQTNLLQTLSTYASETTSGNIQTIFQSLIEQYDLSQLQQITGYITQAGSVFGEKTFQNLTNTLMKGVNQKTLDNLNKVNWDTTFSALNDISRLVTNIGGERNIYSEILNGAIEDLGAEGGVFQKLYNSSGFQNVLENLTEQFDTMGNITAEYVNKLASKNEDLNAVLGLGRNGFVNINTAGLASIFTAINAGQIKSSQVTSGLLSSLSTAGALEAAKQEAFNIVDNQDFGRSGTDLLEYFTNGQKVYLNSQSQNLTFDTPLRNFFEHMMPTEVRNAYYAANENGNGKTFDQIIKDSDIPQSVKDFLNHTNKTGTKGINTWSDVIDLYSGFINETPISEDLKNEMLTGLSPEIQAMLGENSTLNDYMREVYGLEFKNGNIHLFEREGEEGYKFTTKETEANLTKIFSQFMSPADAAAQASVWTAYIGENSSGTHLLKNDANAAIEELKNKTPNIEGGKALYSSEELQTAFNTYGYWAGYGANDYDKFQKEILSGGGRIAPELAANFWQNTSTNDILTEIGQQYADINNLETDGLYSLLADYGALSKNGSIDFSKFISLIEFLGGSLDQVNSILDANQTIFDNINVHFMDRFGGVHDITREGKETAEAYQQRVNREQNEANSEWFSYIDENEQEHTIHDPLGYMREHYHATSWTDEKTGETHEAGWEKGYDPKLTPQSISVGADGTIYGLSQTGEVIQQDKDGTWRTKAEIDTNKVAQTTTNTQELDLDQSLEQQQLQQAWQNYQDALSAENDFFIQNKDFEDFLNNPENARLAAWTNAARMNPELLSDLYQNALKEGYTGDEFTNMYKYQGLEADIQNAYKTYTGAAFNANNVTASQRFDFINEAYNTALTEGVDKLTPFQKQILTMIGEINESTDQLVTHSEEETEDAATRAKNNKIIDNETGQILDEGGNPIEMPYEAPASSTSNGDNSAQEYYPNQTPIGNSALDKFNAYIKNGGNVTVGQGVNVGNKRYTVAVNDNGDYTLEDENGKDISTDINLASGQNNARLLTYASGKTGHIAITGELGPELRVKSDGSMDVLGKKGREYAWVEPDDRIYTASQSAGILKSNKIPGLEGLAKGINNFIPGYATGVGSTDNGPSSSSGSGSGSGDGGGGGGGGSSDKDPRYDPNTLKIRDILERYYTILQKIDDITRAVENFAKAADRAWGQDRLKQLNAQTAAMQKQYEAQKKYVQEIGSYLTVDQSALTSMVTDFVKEYNEGKEDKDKISLVGAQFDENGVLTNYKEIIENLVKQYNANADANAQDKEAQYKFQERLKDIQMYTDTLNLWETETEKLTDLAHQILDNSLKTITYRVEYELELTNDQKALIDFQNSFLKDNPFRTGEYLAGLDKVLSNTKEQLEEVQKGVFDTIAAFAGDNTDITLGPQRTEQDLGLRDEDGNLVKDIDRKAMSGKLDKWIEEIRAKDAKAAEEIEKSVQRDSNGIIANYKMVLDKINEVSKTMNKDAIQLLLSNTQAFFDSLSDVSKNAGWEGLTAEAKTQLTNYRDQMTQLLQTYTSTFNELIDSIGDLSKTFGKQMDAAIDEYDYFESVYKSFRNIIDLTNQSMTDVTADFFKQVNNKSIDNAINKVASTRKNWELAQKNAEQASKVYERVMKQRDQYDVGTSEYNYYQGLVDQAKSNMDTVNNQVEEAHKNFLSSWEDALSKVGDAYKDTVEQASKNFENAFSPMFSTLALLQAQFDREKALDDLYVDNYQRIHDLSKLNRDIQASIDDTDNLKGKQRLRDLQEEINQLQEDGTELSEYDLDILDKKYKLELARQALEDAKDAKSMVRLARDNNGNWSYVYTSNQDEVDEAEQRYEDAIRDMEEANQNYIDNIQDQILQVQQEAQQAILALQPSDFETYEDYLAAVQAIQNSMYQTLDYLRAQMNNAFDNNDWLEGYVPNIVRDHGLTDNFGDTTLAGLLANDNLDSVIDNARRNLEDNLIVPALEAFVVYSEKQQEVYEKAGHDMATIGQAFSEQMEEVGEKSKEQVQIVDELSKRIETSYAEAMQSAVEGVDKWIEENAKLIDQLTKMIEAINELKRLDGETVVKDSAIVRNADDAIDSEAEYNGLTKSLRENGLIRLITTDKNGKEHAIQLTQGSSDTEEYLANARKAVGENMDAIDVGDDGISDNEYKQIKDRLEKWGAVKVKGKKDGKEWTETIYSIEELEALKKKYKYTPPNNGPSGNKYDWGTDPFSWSDYGNHHNSKGEHVWDTGGYTGRWQSADTGMYTGEWPDGSTRRNGRLAWLHQKELVLNAHDTENFLDAMEIVRQLDNLSNWMANGLGDLFTPTIGGEFGELEQNVHIEAEFPNVTDHNEIEQAFNNLVNMASQYANRK